VVLYLYDAAIRSCRKAVDAMESGRPVERWKWFDRAMVAVSELAGALDFEQGGAVAQRLNAIYSFLLRSLISANKSNDPVHVHGCLAVLRTLRAAWEQIAQAPRSGAPAPAEALSGFNV
jgi:flagellar protein FliS